MNKTFIKLTGAVVHCFRVINMAVSQESQMIIYAFNGFRKDGRVWEKGREGYKFNTTALFSWIFLFKKKKPH